MCLFCKENLQELLAAILDSLGWREDAGETMESMWRCFHISYHGILKSGGRHYYPQHCGSRTAHRSNIESYRAITAEALAAPESALVAFVQRQ